MFIANSVFTTAFSSSVTPSSVTTYHNTGDTGASPLVLVSPYSLEASESFWYDSSGAGTWYFDGQTINHQYDRNHYRDSKFYVQVS